MTVIEKLIEKEAETAAKAQAARNERFRALVADLAGGETKMNETALAAALKATGRTPEELQAAVGEELRLDKLRKLAGEYPDLQAESRKDSEALAKLLASEEKERKALEEKYRSVRWEREETNRVLQVRIAESRAAAEELRALGEAPADWLRERQERARVRALAAREAYVCLHLPRVTARERLQYGGDPEACLRARWQKENREQAALLEETK